MSNPSTGSFAVAGSGPGGSADGSVRVDDPACTFEAWVPGSGRPHFGGAGIGHLRVQRVRGGYDITACVHGHYTLRLVSRSRPGLSCPAALSVASFEPRGRRLSFIVRESRHAESACTGIATVRTGGTEILRLRFAAVPGSSRVLRGRLRIASARAIDSTPRLTVWLAGEDVDANRFRQTVSVPRRPLPKRTCVRA